MNRSVCLVSLFLSTVVVFIVFFFFNDTATTEIYTLSLHDALPISDDRAAAPADHHRAGLAARGVAPHRPHRPSVPRLSRSRPDATSRRPGAIPALEVLLCG